MSSLDLHLSVLRFWQPVVGFCCEQLTWVSLAQRQQRLTEGCGGHHSWCCVAWTFRHCLDSRCVTSPSQVALPWPPRLWGPGLLTATDKLPLSHPIWSSSLSTGIKARVRLKGLRGCLFRLTLRPSTYFAGVLLARCHTDARRPKTRGYVRRLSPSVDM